MGPPQGANNYHQQQRELMHRAAMQAADADKWASDLADQLTALINAQTRSPTKNEIVAVLLKSLGREAA